MNVVKKIQKGFLTLEMLIALGLMTLSVSSVIAIVFGTQNGTFDGQMTTQALYKVQAMQEKNRALAATNWDNVVSSSTNDNPFTENITVTDADDFLKSALSQVTWPAQSQTRSTETSTLLFDKTDARDQGSCANAAVGDWTNPHNTSIALNTTGPITGVDVKNGIAYMSADGNGTQKDFFAIDVATGNVLCSMDTGPGLLGIRVSGKYAYAVNTSVNSQLQIIDLAACSYVGYKFSPDTASALYYFNHKVYLGTVTSSIEEFHIIDVSDITNIHELGKKELGEKVNAVYVSNGTAYLASPDNNQELKMLDVSDPTNIRVISGFDAPGSNGNGKSLARKGQRLLLGRAVGNIELYVVHINDIASGAKASADINSSINGLTTIGNLVFLATTDAAKEFQVWKITNDDTSLTPVSNIDLPGHATAIDCENQTVYVTSEDPSHGLTIINPN